MGMLRLESTALPGRLPMKMHHAHCRLCIGNKVLLGSSRSTRPRADRNGYLRNNLKGGATRLMGVIALLSIGDERPLIVLYTRPVPRTGRSPHSAIYPGGRLLVTQVRMCLCISLA